MARAPALALAVWLGAATGAAAQAAESPPASRGGFSWLKFLAGAVTSIAAHEAAHVVTSVVVGGDPSFGFDQGRPVIHSGINGARNPGDQFAFSAAGMTTQLVMNEIILDWPRDGGREAPEFERGILAGGIGTVAFYFTVGCCSAVSDVQLMADHSGFSRGGLAVLFGGVAALDVARIVTKQRYVHFFTAPAPDRRLRIGVSAEF